MNKQLAQLRAALVDLVSDVQQIHRRRRDLDFEVAALYKKARHAGLQVKFAKEIIQTLHGDAASVETIWGQYAKKVGIDDNAAADHLSALDKILGPVSG
jgi:hypothetical protein